MGADFTESKKTVMECVPNISTADDVTCSAVAEAALAAGVKLLGISSCPDHNRSVLTFVGEYDNLIKAVYFLAEETVKRVDISTHSGVHPKMGALDVLPFVPLSGVSMSDCIKAANQTGEIIARELGVPVILYEAAAENIVNKNLADVRRGGFESLFDGSRIYDYGCMPHPTAGAVAIGARRPLVAFNINLETENLDIAKRIAKTIRESSGGYKCVKAMGVILATKRMAQVSMNLTDYLITPPAVVYHKVLELAEREGVRIHSSELVGLMSRDALGAATKDEAEKAAESLKIEGFIYDKHIIEAFGFRF